MIEFIIPYLSSYNTSANYAVVWIRRVLESFQSLVVRCLSMGTFQRQQNITLRKQTKQNRPLVIPKFSVIRILPNTCIFLRNEVFF